MLVVVSLVGATAGVQGASAYRGPNPYTDPAKWGAVQDVLETRPSTVGAPAKTAAVIGEGRAVLGGASISRITAIGTRTLSGGLITGAAVVTWQVGSHLWTIHTEIRDLDATGYANNAQGAQWVRSGSAPNYTWALRYTMPDGVYPNAGFMQWTTSCVNSTHTTCFGGNDGNHTWTPTSTPCNYLCQLDRSFQQTAMGSQYGHVVTTGGTGPGQLQRASRVITTTGELWDMIGEGRPYQPGVDPAPTYSDGADTITRVPSTDPKRQQVLDIIEGADTTEPNGTSDPVEFWIGQKVDPAWEGEPLPDVTMPDCRGLSYAACLLELDEAGHAGVVTRVELGRQGAVITRPAGAVVVSSPAPGETFDAETDVELHTNPETLPLRLPAPVLHETYPEYLARLRGLGWLGDATVVELSETSGDPALGPDAPVRLRSPGAETPQLQLAPPITTTSTRTWPGIGLTVWPDEPIEFTKNPPTYAPPTGAPGDPLPPAGGGGGGCECPPVDFGPLLDVGETAKFPFGIFAWVDGFFDQLGGGAQAPSFTIQKPSQLGGGTITVTAPENAYKSWSDALMKFIVVVGSLWWAASWLLGFGRGERLDD